MSILGFARAEKGPVFESLSRVPWSSNGITPHYNPLEKLQISLLGDGSSLDHSGCSLQYLEPKHMG